MVRRLAGLVIAFAALLTVREARGSMYSPVCDWEYGGYDGSYVVWCCTHGDNGEPCCYTLRDAHGSLYIKWCDDGYGGGAEAV